MFFSEFFSHLSRFLIVEFVPKTDSQVQRLLRSREDIFSGYTQAGFEQEFAPYFAVEEASRLDESERVLYLMKNRRDPA